MITQSKKLLLLGVVVVALVGAGLVGGPIDYLRYDSRAKAQGMNVGDLKPGDKNSKNLLFDLPVQFMGAAALGLREAVAGLLWVRADEFFHTGQYEAIIPIVRLCTWLDPQQIDIYTTGAWHMDYNFTDSAERSDRRYIPPAVALLEEGCENNPDIYDLYFELAWTHYFQKARDYNRSIEWMKKALGKTARDPNTGAPIPQPAFVRRMLAHAYEKAGRFDDSEREWRECIKESHTIYKSDPTEVAIAEKNLGLFLLRRAWRYGDVAAYNRGMTILNNMKLKDGDLIRSMKGMAAGFDKWKASGFKKDVVPEVNANMQVYWKRVHPRAIRVWGSVDLIPVEQYKGLASEYFTHWYADNQRMTGKRKQTWRDGCRVRIMLVDYDYDYWNLPEQKSFSWDLDKTQTVLWDEASTRLPIDDQTIREFKQKHVALRPVFDTVIDMSHDPIIYPLAKDKYKLVVWYNPQEGPDFIQDRIGWKGEGLTDPRYLNTKLNPGYRMILKEFVLKKSDIM